MSRFKMRSVWLGIVLMLSPMCVEVTQACGLPLFTNSKTLTKGMRVFPEKMEMMVTCFNGHALEAPGEGLTYNTTCTNNVWTPVYKCIPVKCTGLPVVANARLLYLENSALQTGNTYPYASEVNVYCNVNWATANGRIQYRTVCTIDSTWSEMSPCSVNQPVQYRKFHVVAPASQFPYTDAHGDPDSQDYQDTKGALTRALFEPMRAQFDSLYIGADNFLFSKLAATDHTQVSFDIIFNPSQIADTKTISSQINDAFKDTGYVVIDPNSQRKFYFRQVEVEGSTGFYIDKASVVGLSIGGAVVGVMALALICTCIACREKPCCPRREGPFYGRGGHRNPYLPERDLSPYSDTYGLPRTNIY